MSSQHEIFYAQLHQHPNLAIHYENIDRDKRIETYRKYMQYVQLLLNMKLLGDNTGIVSENEARQARELEFFYKTSIKIFISNSFDVNTMQEQIQYHRSELRRLQVDIVVLQRNAGENTHMTRLKHHQKIHQWLVYEIQKERMFIADYKLAARSQYT